MAGYNDWRMPNIVELAIMTDYGRTAPDLDTTFGAPGGWPWSSTSVFDAPNNAFVTQRLGGTPEPTFFGFDKAAVMQDVRAVRGGL